MSDPRIAWAAGVFEGEGCISVVRSGPQAGRRASLNMKMTDRDVIERFRAAVGRGSIHEDKWYARRGQPSQWRWRVSAQSDVLHILDAFEPFLGERRRAASAAARAVYES